MAKTVSDSILFFSSFPYSQLLSCKKDLYTKKKKKKNFWAFFAVLPTLILFPWCFILYKKETYYNRMIVPGFFFECLLFLKLFHPLTFSFITVFSLKE